jgi:gliding motility-associated-like protein
MDLLIDTDSVNCPNSEDGRMEITGYFNRDDSIYNYSFGLNDTTNFTADTIYENLEATEHTIYIEQINTISGARCIYPDLENYYDIEYEGVFYDSITLSGFLIFEPSPITADITTLPSEKEEPTGIVWVHDIAGGTPGYSFSMDSLNFVDFSNLDTLLNQMGNVLYGDHEVYVKDSRNCVETFEASIGIKFYVPNIFTPNGDGKNDTFIIHSLPEGSRLKVYDRWGIQAYYSSNYDNSWDGGDQPDGTYFYELNTSIGTQKGWIQIIR